MDIIKIENHPGIVKDKDSKAVLATDTDALAAHKKKREESRKIEYLERRVFELSANLDVLSKTVSNMLKNCLEYSR